MSDSLKHGQDGIPARDARPASSRRRNIAVFVASALAVLAADVATKSYFNFFPLGEVVAGPFGGIFRFRLVHNTGAAWSMFDDATLLLGVFSLAVCAFVLGFLLKFASRAPLPFALGAGLVFAGGLGNALDRFTLGYVVDFIEPVFVDFPVFNVADIGVTCGMALVVVSLLFLWRDEDSAA